MHPPKVDVTGTYIYTLTFHLSPTCIHIVGVNQAYVRGSSSHVKLNFKKYRLFVRLKFYHLKNIEQTDVDKSKRR